MPEPTRQIRVLIVEDNPGDVRLLREQLRSRGNGGPTFVVEELERIDDSIDRLRRQPDVDVVLLDLSLPDAHGLATVRRLLSDVEDCPAVVVMTGNADHDVAADSVAAGAQDFLVKGSVEADLLVRSIQYARERHRSRLELERALARETEMVGRLRELDRLKSRFVAMASHELRTPLASISGFAATLRTRWTNIADDDRLAYIRIIDEQGARLTRLVDDLLVLSRIESGAVEVRAEAVGVEAAIHAVLTDLDTREHSVVVDVPPTVQVFADPDHLGQMLVNYVTNAIKYGEAPITVQVRPHGSSYVDVLVCDSGAGVPQDIESVLFEEFVRGRGHSAAQIPGTGLGLSIVRGLARAQGGDAWHEPNVPVGSVFALRLPSPAG
jgi:phosphoserine phosphatase RsbU/P